MNQMIPSKQDNISLVGSQYALANTEPLTSMEFRDLLKRRAVSVLRFTPDEETWQESEDLRRKTERRIFEKINKENNLLPVDFLSKGVEKAKAICRISTPTGLGTGFLIDNGILMTNHHVISTVKEANNSMAEFGYEEHHNPVTVKLKPEDLFITSSLEELDFTIVGCETTGIEEVLPIKLLRSPTTITRGEYANIIQHPKGRKKEVALQDNTVSFIYDKVIRYTTDTEPGSSGSAVFNNDWQLVALHHAGWYTDDDGYNAENEGIRISAIVSKLIALAKDGDEGAARVIQNLEDTSPYLGFYDTEGLDEKRDANPGMQEPIYKGSQSFADIGFWNLDSFYGQKESGQIKLLARDIANLSMDTLGLVAVDEKNVKHFVEEAKEYGAALEIAFLETEETKGLFVLFDATTTKVEIQEELNQKYRPLLQKKVDGIWAFPKGREPLFALCTITENSCIITYLMILANFCGKNPFVSKTQNAVAAETISIIAQDIKQSSCYKDIPIIIAADYQTPDLQNELASSQEVASVLLASKDGLDGSMIFMDASKIEALVYANDMKAEVSINRKDIEEGLLQIQKNICDTRYRECSFHPIAMRLIYKEGVTAAQLEENAYYAGVKYVKDHSMAGILLHFFLNGTKTEEEIPYYDEKSDKEDCLAYYPPEYFKEAKTEVLEELHKLLKNSHTTVFSVKQSRNLLFSQVDLQKNRKLRSIYSEQEMDPEHIIIDDYKEEQRRRDFLQSIKELPEKDRERLTKMFEDRMIRAVEYAVPLSWYDSLSPMKSDLHQMFTCESALASFRNEFPYFDFSAYHADTYREFLKCEFGKRGGMERFEPANGKGEVARAVLYFLIRYPYQVCRNKIDIELMKAWHKNNPVSTYEKHRNQTIFRLQGNRNPFIDFPELAGNIDF